MLYVIFYTHVLYRHKKYAVQITNNNINVKHYLMFPIRTSHLKWANIEEKSIRKHICIYIKKIAHNIWYHTKAIQVDYYKIYHETLYRIK